MIAAALLFELAWKSLVVAGAALGVLRLARRRSAGERSWIAHCGLAALVLLIPAAILAPAWNPVPLPAPIAAPAVPTVLVEMPELAQADSPRGAPAEVAPAAAPAWALPTAGELVVWAYAVPLVLLLLAMIVAVARLFAMHRRANVLVEAPWLAALAQAQRRMGFKHGTALLVSDELHSPVSWGMMRPIILLNPAVIPATDEAEAIIAHELAHVARLDWAKLLLARVACAVFWFNPLVWRLARESHQLREEAADDAVLLSDVDGADYASLLVNAARHDNQALLLAAHGVAPAKDSLKRRITRVLDGNLARRPADIGWIALCLVVVLGIAGPLAALEPSAETRHEAGLIALDEEAGAIDRAVAQAVGEAVPSAVQGALQGEHAALADDSDAGDEGDSEADRLIEMKAVGATPEYLAAMQAAGFRGPMDDLIEARAVGVTPEFAQEVRRFSPNATLEEVVEARAVGLSAEFIGQMRAVFPGLSMEDAVGMAALQVTPDYVRAMRRLFSGLTAEQAVELKAVGVTPEFVERMRREGLSARTPDEAVEGRLFTQSAADVERGPPPSVVGPSRLDMRGPDGSMSLGPPPRLPGG
jgi:beta-lactamase regulating signal transducer with metallopeptidase domain